MTKRILIAALLVLCAAGIWAQGAKKTTISVWYHAYGEEGTKEAVERYGKLYEKANPNVSVEVVWMPGNWRQKLYTSLASKASDPDVFEESAPSYTWVKSGQVASLDDLFSKEVKADLFPSTLASVTIEGKIYGAPMFIDSTAFYYRPSIFKAAGVSVPKTFAELTEISKKLTTSKRKGLYIGNSAGAGTLGFMVAFSGTKSFISDDGKTVTFNNPGTVAAIEELRKLATSGSLLLGYPVSEWQPDALVNDECAIQFGGLWSYPQFKKELGNDMGVFMIPPVAGGRPTASAGGYSSMVNGNSDQIAEAKKWVKWAWIDSNPEVQLDFATAYGFHVPAKKSLYNKATALKNDPLTALIVDATSDYGIMKTGAGYGDSSLWDSVMNTAFTDLLSAVAKENVSVAQLVRKTAEQVQARLTEVNK